MPEWALAQDPPSLEVTEVEHAIVPAGRKTCVVPVVFDAVDLSAMLAQLCDSSDL